MNTCSRWPERAVASSMPSRWVVATDGCPVSSFLGVRQAVPARSGDIFPEGCGCPVLVAGRLIASVSARRYDGSEFIEIEIDDGLQGRGGGGVAEAIRQGVVPGGIFSLQGE